MIASICSITIGIARSFHRNYLELLFPKLSFLRYNLTLMTLPRLVRFANCTGPMRKRNHFVCGAEAHLYSSRSNWALLRGTPMSFFRTSAEPNVDNYITEYLNISGCGSHKLGNQPGLCVIVHGHYQAVGLPRLEFAA